MRRSPPLGSPTDAAGKGRGEIAGKGERNEDSLHGDRVARRCDDCARARPPGSRGNALTVAFAESDAKPVSVARNFASATLGKSSAGDIDVLGGFAAAKRDGKAAVVCISFKNVSSRAARRVAFEFPISGRQGRELGSMQLDRRGEFSPGIAIKGWQSLSDWQGGVGHRGYGDNCTMLSAGDRFGAAAARGNGVVPDHPCRIRRRLELGALSLG